MIRKLREEGMLGKRSLYFVIILVLTVVIDRITKYLAFKNLTQPIEFNSFFSLYFITNTGAAFGILKGSTVILTIISIFFIALIIYKLKEIIKEDYFWAAALILGGALSNMFDRIFYKFVVDFIAIGRFPVFNMADSAITIGVTGVFCYLFFTIKKSRN